MFIGRERELQSLETVYAKEGFGMTVIYGRRRVGKSTLITEFRVEFYSQSHRSRKSGD